MRVGATCQSSDQLVSGGYAITPTTYIPTASYPSDAHTWTVEASTIGVTDTLTVTAYANCLHGAPSIGATIVTATKGYPAGLSAGPVAQCPSGTSITGGGFHVTSDRALIESTFPGIFSGTPYFTFADVAPDSGMAETYAICAKAAAIVTTVVDDTVSVSTGAATHLAADCPVGRLLVGGGFGAASDASQRPYYHFSDTADIAQPLAHWTTDVNYTQTTALTIFVFAVCASFPNHGIAVASHTP